MTRVAGIRRRRPAALVAITGFLVLAVLVTVAALAMRAPNGLPLSGGRTLYAAVPDIGNVRRHNEVRISGVRVGQVIRREVHDGVARLTLRLDGGTGAIPADSRVFIRGRGLLGQRYVELRLGRSTAALAEGATIKGDATTLTYGVPDALDTFDDETRHALGETIGELGKGLLGRGRGLNGAISAGPQVGADWLALTRAIYARSGALDRLTPSVAAFASQTAPAALDVAAALRPTARALRPLASERVAVRGTLTEAPQALAAAQPGLHEGRELVAALDRLARSARTNLTAAPAGMRAAAALLRDAPAPLRRLPHLLDATSSAVPDVLRVTRALSPALSPLQHALTTLREPVKTLGRYGCDIDNFAENWRDFLAYAVPGGGSFAPLSAIRVEALTGPGNITGAGKLTTSLGDPLVDNDPYPRPCRFSPGSAYPLTGGEE